MRTATVKNHLLYFLPSKQSPFHIGVVSGLRTGHICSLGAAGRCQQMHQRRNFCTRFLKETEKHRHLSQKGKSRNVKNIPLFILYTLLIWGCYFYHFYLTFYSFSFAEHLGFQAAMVMFVGGTFAVIVPTPNGAGPWHFAVITMMMLYGVNATDAGAFALIVHGIQTLLVCCSVSMAGYMFRW